MPYIILLALGVGLLVTAEDEPTYTVEVHCPFTISDADAVTIDTNQGLVELGAPSIQLEPPSDPCPGHTLKVRR